MPNRSTMVDRMIGAAKLDVAIYEEVEHDESATGQAAGVVAMVAVAQAVAEAGGGAGMAVLGWLALVLAFAIPAAILAGMGAALGS